MHLNNSFYLTRSLDRLEFEGDGTTATTRADEEDEEPKVNLNSLLSADYLQSIMDTVSGNQKNPPAGQPDVSYLGVRKICLLALFDK